MPCYICTTCGVQHAETSRPPDLCAVCEDERQYVNWDGQAWVTLDELRRDPHTPRQPEEARPTGLLVEPTLPLGQLAPPLQTPPGKLFWPLTTPVVDRAARGGYERGRPS